MAIIINKDSAIIVFLFPNVPAAVYNLLLPPITFGGHYIRNTWNGRSSRFAYINPAGMRLAG
jgi:hypothetical protein